MNNSDLNVSRDGKFPPKFGALTHWFLKKSKSGEHSPGFYYGCLENVPKLIENVHFAKIFACGGLISPFYSPTHNKGHSNQNLAAKKLL